MQYSNSAHSSNSIVFASQILLFFYSLTQRTTHDFHLPPIWVSTEIILISNYLIKMLKRVLAPSTCFCNFWLSLGSREAPRSSSVCHLEEASSLFQTAFLHALLFRWLSIALITDDWLIILSFIWISTLLFQNLCTVVWVHAFFILGNLHATITQITVVLFGLSFEKVRELHGELSTE